jgi:isopenicillin N synthase-like dioxygenase
MADPTPTIPIIDISALFQEDLDARASLLMKWDTAMRDVGFAVIIGHQVPPEIGNSLYDESKAFFHLPAAEKGRAKISEKYGAGGYAGKGSISLFLF